MRKAGDNISNQSRVIQTSEILAKIEQGEPVRYDNVIVEGDLDISGLDLPTEHVDRTNYEIEYLGLADEAKTVRSPISIKNSEIRCVVNLGNAIYQESVNFSGTKFIDEVYFMGAVLNGSSEFVETHFNHDAYFWKAKFNYFANFNLSQFNRDAYFWGVQFNAPRNISSPSFRRTQFNGELSFKNTVFNRLESQEIVCRLAKRKMEDQGNKNDADYYFYREMEAIRKKNGIKGTGKLKWPWNMRLIEANNSKFKRWIKLIGSKIWRLGRYDIFEYIFIQGIFGYGVRPLRLFAYWILMALAFALIYWYYDAVEGASAWFDYIWFSIATSATPGYALYNPIGHYKIVTGIQAIIGTFMWAAFIATFARKWQR